MKLNKEDKVKLRIIIEEQLKKVPEGQRLHFDRELLESLLFETYVEELHERWCEKEDIGKKIPVKYIVWSGPFLSKIDLSEVSFEDMMWDVEYFANTYFVNGTKQHYKENEVTSIDLSNTNAKIDFSKSFGFGIKYAVGSDLVDLEVALKNCTFAGTDLSNNFINYNFFASCCNFSNTGLKINLNSKCYINLYKSILSGLDFAEYTVDERFFGGELNVPHADKCDLSNTGLRVKTSDIPDYIYSYSKKQNLTEEQQKEYNSYLLTLENMDRLGKSIKKGYLIGCYVNDKLILSQEQKQSVRQEKKEEYVKMKADLYDATIQSIEQQVSGFGRK